MVLIMSDNNEQELLFLDAIPEQDSGNKLKVTSLSSVQPAVLTKLGVFVPARIKGMMAEPIDASDDLTKLSFATSEGYTNVEITGPKLNMTTDFKIWMGIILSFSRSPQALTGNKIRLSFTEFARNCDYSNKRFDSRLRKEVRDSLVRIRSKTVTFTKAGAKKVYTTGLLKTMEFDIEANTIILEADEKLWELYRDDTIILLRKKALLALKRKEAAQVLYTFIESLPANPIPLSFERLRKRLALQSSISEQNRIIRKNLAALEEVGYLKFYYLKDGRDTKIKITHRDPHLKLD